MLYYPATQFLGIYKNTHTRIVIEALFIIAPNWGLHICLSTREWVNTLWYFPTMPTTRQLKRINYFYLWNANESLKQNIKQ